MVFRPSLRWALLVTSLAVAGLATYLLFAGAPPRLPRARIPSAISIARTTARPEGGHLVAGRPRLASTDPASLHDWLVEVTDQAGAPVSGCRLTFAASMPEHGHGVPTEPRVLGEEGKGRYLVGGVRFSMPGTWVVTVKLWGCGAPQRVDFDVRF